MKIAKLRKEGRVRFRLFVGFSVLTSKLKSEPCKIKSLEGVLKNAEEGGIAPAIRKPKKLLSGFIESAFNIFSMAKATGIH